VASIILGMGGRSGLRWWFASSTVLTGVFMQPVCVKGTKKNVLAISLKKVYTMIMLYKVIRRKIREASTVCRDSASARLYVVIYAGEPEGEKHL
jgi:hypothetical protein